MSQPDLSAFKFQYQRLLEAAECRTQAELAAFLEVRQSSVSDAKRRQSIPAEWRITLLAKKWINPFWILNGEGARYLVPSYAVQEKPRVLRVTEIRPPQECSIHELFTEMVRRVVREQEKTDTTA